MKGAVERNRSVYNDAGQYDDNADAGADGYLAVSEAKARCSSLSISQAPLATNHLAVSEAKARCSPLYHGICHRTHTPMLNGLKAHRTHTPHGVYESILLARQWV